MAPKITLRQLRQLLNKYLETYSTSGEVEMWIRMLIEHHTGIGWQQWVTDPELRISSETASAIRQDAEELRRGKPIQYILGSAHFYGRDFYVNPAVLIPRRETEELMVWIRDSLKGEIFSKDPLQILDIGTGSGCIPISLACEWKMMNYRPQISATDISPDALAIARKNAQLFGTDIQWLEADIFTMTEKYFSNLDIVISNPPYVREAEKAKMEARVTDYEPGLALFVPDDDPLRYYEQIGRLAAKWLRPGGFLFFEINEAFGKELEVVVENLGFEEIIVKKDLQGKDRMLRCRAS